MIPLTGARASFAASLHTLTITQNCQRSLLATELSGTQIESGCLLPQLAGFENSNQLIPGHRLGEQIPLRKITTHTMQGSQISRCLYAFRDGEAAEAMSKINDSLT
jgi:hypothetical protein